MPMTVDERTQQRIDAFCDQIWLQDGLAAASIASYRRDLVAIAGWLRRRGATLETAQRSDVEAFLADQFKGKAKATSIARRLSTFSNDVLGSIMSNGQVKPVTTGPAPKAAAPVAAPKKA